MESIPGYDDWKTTPPDDPEPASVCDCCGCEVYEGDYIYTIDGERLCEGEKVYIRNEPAIQVDLFESSIRNEGR